MKIYLVSLSILAALDAVRAFSALPTSRAGVQERSNSRHGHGYRRHPYPTSDAIRHGNVPLRGRSFLKAQSTTSGDTTSSYQSIFNFTNPTENAVSKFERIDDAIMGGISLSSIRQQDNEDFARWSGVCRTDGGGFCGTRTLPFEQPLKVGADAEGFYLLCRFTSDDEPERRVWKMTTRTENSRGEQLYQAMFEIPKESSSEEWQRILVPFTSFAQVRGPRLVVGAMALNVTGGLFQIGVSLSKFQMGANVTEISDFRAGYFELQLKEIGVYNSAKVPADEQAEASLLETSSVQTLTKEEAKKKRPILLKILSPVTSILFSEKGRRRQSAVRILRKRGMSRWDIIKFAFKNRAARIGVVGAVFETLAVSLQDAFRFLLGSTLRIVVFLPFILCLRIVRVVTKGKTKSAA